MSVPTDRVAVTFVIPIAHCLIIRPTDKEQYRRSLFNVWIIKRTEV